MSKEKEIAFLKDLKSVMQNHGASFEISCEGAYYGEADTSLYFDLDGVSCGNEIVVDVKGADISTRDIDVLIRELEAKT